MTDEDSIGRIVLGRYRVVLRLGRGGQGAVYLARGEGAAGFARPVVVKRSLHPVADEPEALEQFAREARITAEMRHPSIVSVIDFAHDGSSNVMVLEYVHGYDLRRWERFVHGMNGRFAPELVVYPLLRVLDALDYAHNLRGPDGGARGVIHRDVSPANVLIDVAGHVKLTDFGIARMANDETSVATSKVRLKGKIPYLAPEMFRGARASVQTDLYACGVMLHELLAGRNEFHASSVMESVSRIAKLPPSRLDELRPELPSALVEVAARALEKDPAARYQSARELARDLRAAIDLPDAELGARFREAIVRDFRHPRFAQVVGRTPLDELDAAWREGGRASLHDHLPPPLADEPLLAEGPSATQAPETVARHRPPGERAQAARPHRERAMPLLSPTAWFLACAALIGGISLRMAWAEQGPQFVYVRQERLANAADDGASALDVTRAELDPTQLTDSFAGRSTNLASCFSEHGDSLENAPPEALHVVFSVSAEGQVLSSHVEPADVAATPLGQCIDEVARATTFGSLPRALSFRIPIAMRSER